MTLFKKSLFLLIFGISFCNIIYADSLDSLSSVKSDSNAVFYFYNNNDSILPVYYHIDTTLSESQDYNPLNQAGLFNSSLGNIGLAHQNLFFNPNKNTEFSFGVNTFNGFLYSNNEIKYYKNIKPYTNLRYVMGDKKEQYFHVIHSHSFGEGLSFAIDFKFINSIGAYERQFADDKNLVLNTQYKTKNKRYGIIANYIHNKINVNESGGIIADSVFEQNLENDRSLISVNLLSAENLIKNSSIFVNQHFYLSKDYNVVIADTTNDSIIVKQPIKKRFKLGRISHSFSWSKNNYCYTDFDPLNSFYQSYDTVVDSIQTFDSTYYLKVENQFSWSNLNINDKPEDKAVFLYFRLKHLYAEIGGYSDKKFFSQIIPSGGFSVFVLKSFRLNCDANIVIGDYNDGDLNLHAQIQQYLGVKDKNLGLLILDANFLNKEANYFYQNYNSNHFRWENNFKKQQIISGNATYKYKGWQTGINYHLLNNFIFLNSVAHPQQADESFSIFQAFLYKNFILGKFNIDNHIVYQNVSNSSILQLPEILANVKIQFTQILFKNAAIIQPGVNIYYNSLYYANSYMPALRSFYIQNDKEIGNFIYADIFLNLKIKRTRFFIKYQNINGLFSGYNYYLTPHYPMQDASFKFGLIWKFYD